MYKKLFFTLSFLATAYPAPGARSNDIIAVQLAHYFKCPVGLWRYLSASSTECDIRNEIQAKLQREYASTQATEEEIKRSMAFYFGETIEARVREKLKENKLIPEAYKSQFAAQVKRDAKNALLAYNPHYTSTSFWQTFLQDYPTLDAYLQAIIDNNTQAAG